MTYILVILAALNQPIPTLQFKTQADCVAALTQLQIGAIEVGKAQLNGYCQTVQLER